MVIGLKVALPRLITKSLLLNKPRANKVLGLPQLLDHFPRQQDDDSYGIY